MQNTEKTKAEVIEKIPFAVVNDMYYAVTIDGNTTNMDKGTVYRGLGVISGNNSSRLLMDYKTENPDAYWEIMNLLFKKDYGAGLTYVKIELGTDVNSSSGTEPSIMSFGVRYLTAEFDAWSAENGNGLKIYPDGRWELRKNAATVMNGTILNFDGTVWHSIKITAAGINITAEVDGKIIAEYADEIAPANSGRVSIGCAVYNNIFDNLNISPVEGYKSTITRVDDHDASITYTGDWYRKVPDGYVHFNRTISRAEISEGDISEKSFEFSFTGNRFALIGQSDAYTIEIYIDSKLFETKKSLGANARQCSCAVEVPDGAHNVKIKVVGGKFTLDAIEY